MDFHSLKRRDLQSLCKKNNIAANMTNTAMADALKSLDTVEGVEEILGQLETRGSESPERSVITSPNVPQTSTCPKPSKEGLDCSKLATRTRCGTRRVAVNGADNRKTPATRTRRRRATQEASIQQKMEKNLQAKFEEDLEQSEVSEINNGVESIETLEEVSGVIVDEGWHIQPGTQNEPVREVPKVNNDGGEIANKGGDRENLEIDHVVNEVQEESIEEPNNRQKVDFHSLGRKDLQNLCKKNKIPASMTNAAMADALGSLDTIEGLEEFLKGYDPLAVKSPGTSRMMSSRVRQTRTGQKTTEQRSARAGSALRKSLAKKMEDFNLDDRCSVSMNADVVDLSVEVNANLQSHLEACLEKSAFVDYVPDNCSTINGESEFASEEVSNELDTSIDTRETGKELQYEMVENKSDGSDREGTGTEKCDTTGQLETNLKLESNIHNDSAGQDDALENAGDNQEVKASNSEGDIADIINTITYSSDEPTIGKGWMPEAPETEIALDECTEFDDKIDIIEIPQSDTNSFDQPDVKGLMREAPALWIEGSESSESPHSLEADNGEGSKGGPSTKNSEQGDSVNEDDIAKDISTVAKDEMDPKSEDSNVAEDFDTMVKDDSKSNEDSHVAEGINTGLKVDTQPKLAANCTIKDEYLKSGWVLDLKCANEVHEVSSSAICPDYECEKLVTSIPDAAKSLCPTEKLNNDNTEDQLSKKFVSDSVAEVGQDAPNVEGTPLCHKSLRKLKKMLKQKLQETNSLAKKMEKLTLEDDETPVDNNNSDVDITKHIHKDFREGTKETGETSDQLNSTILSGVDNRDEESNDGLLMKATIVPECGKVLWVDQIDGFHVTGHSNVEPVECESSNWNLEKPRDKGATEVDKQVRTKKQSNEPTALRPVGGPELGTITYPFTPSRSSKTPKQPIFTPGISASKTPLSPGRTNRILDANKENPDDSASNTEPGKIRIAVASPMSIGKLKKEGKELLQQSDKKRPPLQSRSDNQCPLASP